jgi:hypothetical protein
MMVVMVEAEAAMMTMISHYPTTSQKQQCLDIHHCPQIYHSLRRIVDKICNCYCETCNYSLATVIHEGEQERIAQNIPLYFFFHVMRVSSNTFQIDTAALNAFLPSFAPLYRHWGSVQAVRPIGGSRGIALPFLDHGIRRGWGVSVTPWPLFTPGKDPVPIVQEAGWATGPVLTGADNLASTGIRFPDRPAHSQSLYRLRYPEHLTDLYYIIGYVCALQ